jgi:fructokinase
MKIISIGEVLWDILPAAEHLGGAPYNFALHAHNLGHEVCFVSAVGHDQHGNRILEQMAKSGLATRFIHRTSNHPTGTVTVAVDPAGLPQFKIHRPAAYEFPTLSPSEFDALLKPAPDWIYFGTLQQMSAPAHDLTIKLLTAAPTARYFYDVNLRVDSFNPELVRTLARRAHVLKLNEQEVSALQEIAGIQVESREQFCRSCLRVFQLDAVCITLGPEGCALLRNNEYLEATGYPIQVADTIGAGDAFSAALLHGLNSGWPLRQIADFSNRVGALVASRPGGTPAWSVDEALAL